MHSVLTGKAFVYNNNIDTDQIYPGRYLELVDPKDIAKHCMEGADPTFVERMSYGDIIVAGTNFGCGSSREHAVIALISAGVSVVLAESFARIFFRNSINLALPLMVCPGISKKVSNGDILEVNLREGIVLNKTKREIIQGQKISEHAMNILENGGIKHLFQIKTQKMHQEKSR
ncbi:3-isopropylmalate dehydratase small subunit 1 [Tepidanaerobacter acetatoxydans Re1]|uniref:3-isopropylmalate dehydratase small subunit n=1 Tax=Tepidanaerobacter acetatoxydans (strain DSM 21804 / JCM 16047 / Re1) TaxID=1209989 RepID=F4LSM0_TEPAE|nr:3-isopropylmalate dehydratase small subunit [Tepidanaerobacter acetatoxydans]AEE92410.1 3-isopropylmalate dehydratase small subunit [Tepidanaerobacter acetatoxydans Re1]CCP27312.1 3-isopropylmalate dehydratase small subunit 1 [Tepidanaerobacter acetatoxydans Re1]